MWKITRKLMGSNARMLIPAGIAVFLGSVFVTCALLFGNVLDISMRQSLTEQFGGANYVISADTKSNVAPQADSLTLAKLQSIDHVEGVREDRTEIIEVSAASSTSKQSKHATVMVTQTSETDAMNPVHVVEGELPSGTYELAIPQSQAKQLGVSVGQKLDVAVEAQEGVSDAQQFTLTGVTNDDNSQYVYYGGVGLMSPQAMGALFSNAFASENSEETPAFSPIYLRIGDFPKDKESYADYYDSASVEREYAKTIQDVKQALPKHTVLQSRTDFADQRLKEMGGGASTVTTTFLMVFAVLAMFVAALVIANTFQVLVAQRKRILALLRTIGAKRGQIYRSVLLEGAILGIISTLIAVLVGIGLMVLMIVLMPKDNSTFGLIALRDLGRVITPAAVLIPIAFGTLVTVIACMGSARAATKVSPLEALHSVDTLETVSKGKVRLVFGILLMIIGIGASLVAIIGTNALNDPAHANDTNTSDLYLVYLLAAMAACMLFMIGMLMLTNRWVPALLKGVGQLVGKIGPSSSVAAANLRRNPKRVAATSAALLIGVTLIATLSTGAMSVRQSIANTLDEHYSIDVTVSTGGTKPTEKQVNAVRNIDGMSDAVRIDYVDLWTENGNSVRVYVPQSQEQLDQVMNKHTGFMPKAGELVVPESYTEGNSTSWKVGKQFELTDQATNTKLSLKIASAPYQSVAQETVYYAMVSPQTLNEHNIKITGAEIWAKVSDKNDATSVLDRVRKAMGDQDSIFVGGSVAERSMYDQMITVILRVMLALIAVAMVIAIIGVANTLSLSVIERTRESATLRALGMTRAQLRKSLAIEAVMIAVAAGIVGIIVGTLFGWLGTYIVCSLMGKVTFAFDWITALAVIVGGVVCALIASVLPARRAVRTPPVVALAQAD